MHWIDRIARVLLRRGRKHIIASGTSISGNVHIGHCNDVFIADAICRAVKELGGEASAFWYADDFDPMRRIPWPLNEGELAEKYKQYLGMPYINIPSPDPNYENFVDFFARPFIESLDDFGIRVKIYSGAEVYRSGRMAKIIKRALEQAYKIRAILNRYRAEPLPEDWLPYDPVCQKCGRIATTRAYAWEGNYVSYRCDGCDYVEGCGNEGEVDYTKGEGKLTWRVEWPARWKLLRVSCEPFGKDHAVVGGSYDTGKMIAKRVFGCNAPYPVPYEWMSLMGKRMSSSWGIVFTLPKWLSIAEPELLRYFIFRSKAMKAKNFDPGLPLLDLYDEYDRAEQIYLGEVKVETRKRRQIKRIYELSQLRPLRGRRQRVPFRFAAVLSQIVEGDMDRAIDILTKRGFLFKPNKSDVERAIKRISLSRNWVAEYAPEHLRFRILEALPDRIKEELTPQQKQGLKQLALDLEVREYEPVEFHNRVYEVARKIGFEPSELFEAIYLVLIGRSSGPRAGNLVTALEREFVTKRFQETG